MRIYLDLWDLLPIEVTLLYGLKHLFSVDIRWKNPMKFLLSFNLGYKNCKLFFRFFGKYYRFLDKYNFSKTGGKQCQ